MMEGRCYCTKCDHYMLWTFSDRSWNPYLVLNQYKVDRVICTYLSIGLYQHISNCWIQGERVQQLNHYIKWISIIISHKITSHVFEATSNIWGYGIYIISYYLQIILHNLPQSNQTGSLYQGKLEKSAGSIWLYRKYYISKALNILLCYGIVMIHLSAACHFRNGRV